VYGEYKSGDAAKTGRDYLKKATIDFELLDKEVDKVIWTYTNLFPGCLIKSIEGIRLKKKFFWDQSKVINRHWLAANMSGEAFLGFNAFNTKKITGTDVIEFHRIPQAPRRRRIPGYRDDGSRAGNPERITIAINRPTITKREMYVTAR